VLTEIQETNTTVLTFVIEHFTGVQGEVGRAEGGLVAAAIHVDLLIPGVGLALEAGPVDQEGVRLHTIKRLDHMGFISPDVLETVSVSFTGSIAALGVTGLCSEFLSGIIAVVSSEPRTAWV
jgi:hypothetical protein